MDWEKLASNDIVDRVSAALKQNGMNVVVVDTGEEAKIELLKLIPKGSEVMQVSSTTLDEIGVTKEIDDSGDYISLRKMIRSVSDNVERNKLRKKYSSPAYAVGSVQAISEDGKLFVASASGSQIPPYNSLAEHLILVVSTNKIVKDTGEAINRIYEHALPLESQRVQKMFNLPKSSVNKILIFIKEPTPNRTTMILMKEKHGF